MYDKYDKIISDSNHNSFNIYFDNINIIMSAHSYCLGRSFACPNSTCKQIITKDTDLVCVEILKHDGIDDGIMTRCPHCNQRIIACFHCDFVSMGRIHKRIKYNLKRHNERVHSSISAASDADSQSSSRNEIFEDNQEDSNLEPIAAVDVEDDDLHGSTNNEMSVDEDNQEPMKEVRLDHFKSTGDIHAARYFFDNHRASGIRFGGIKAMVYRCINQTDYMSFADEETTKLYFDLLSLTFDMPDSLREKQMRLIKTIFESHQRRLHPGEVVLTFPVSRRNLNQQILCNKWSMSNQLPTEQIQVVDGHHAFVSIGDTIDMMMAHGELPLGWLQDENGNPSFDGVNGCPAARALLDNMRQKIRKQGLDPNNVAIGWVSPWSDGFVTSWVKMAKKGSWMFTVSICMPPNCKLFRLYTHVVALGPSSENHDDLIVHALTEINTLSTVKRRYCGVRRDWIQTAFGMLVYAADRPERHSITYTLDGGNYGRRFGYSAFINKCYLPSCQVCFKSRIMRLSLNAEGDNPYSDTHSCELCCDWNYDNAESEGWRQSSSLEKIFHRKEEWKKYPKSSSEEVQLPLSRALPEESHIRPRRLTFQFLIAGVAAAFYNITTGTWHMYQKDMYLQTFGVSGAILEMCAQASTKAKEELAAIGNALERGERLKSMLTTDELIRLGAIPKIWSLGSTMGLDIDHFIEIPMHHLFTGM